MSYNHKTKEWEGFIYIIRNDIHPEKVYIGQTSLNPFERWYKHATDYYRGVYTAKLYNAMKKYGKEHFALDVIADYKLPTKELLFERLNEMEKYFIQRFDSYYHGYNSNKGGKDSLEQNQRKVCQYDLDGNFICEYESVKAVKEQLEYRSVSTIYDCCLHNDKTQYAYGYMWRYADDDTPLPKLSDSEKEEARIRFLALNPIDEYDYKGNKLTTYSSVDSVLDLNPNYTRRQLLRCLTGGAVYVGTKVYRFEGEPFDKYRTYRINPKLVEQYDFEGNFIKVYESVRQAAKENGLCSPQIADVCSHRHGHTAGGFRWKYVEEDELRMSMNSRSVAAYERNQKKRSSA